MPPLSPAPMRVLGGCGRLGGEANPGRRLWLAVVLTVSIVFGTSARAEEPKAFAASLGIHLVKIPAGRYLRGSPDSDADSPADEKPQREVSVSAFELAVHSVTVGQFEKFAEEEKYQTDAEKDGLGGRGWNAATKAFENRRPQYHWRHPGFPQTKEHPVVNVSWNDARAFCAWLSKKDGRRFQLPTEAQWEYACRAGTTTRFFSGEKMATITGYANVADESLKRECAAATWALEPDDGHPFTAPVGSYQPNPWGLYDMAGNVGQWCADAYDKDFYQTGPTEDPVNENGPRRVTRGGSYFSKTWFCRSARRFFWAPQDSLYNIGFRVAVGPSR